ncbi:MAG TPA: hypothetical protein VEA41_13335, partial [Salinarimonas sp.]|nr:hypothetical protein [Salinarimonas sp.]
MVGSLLERHGRVGIVAHDAGAANHLLAWIEPWMLPRIVPVIAGPARALWERRFLGAPTAGLDDLVTCGAVVTGSGWASDLEHAALRRARERGTLSVAVIDHWVNYRVRFLRAGVLALPDAIWVTDEDALAIARREIPEVPCHIQPNLHLAEQLRRLRPAGEVDGDRLLYVAEPIRVDWGLAVPGEFAALDFFARSLPALRLPPGT